MANVETEQKEPFPTLRSGDHAPSSVAVCEENLAALLRALTAAEEPAPSIPPLVEVLPPPPAESHETSAVAAAPAAAATPPVAEVASSTTEPEPVEDRAVEAAATKSLQPDAREEAHSETQAHDDAAPLPENAPLAPVREVAPAAEVLTKEAEPLTKDAESQPAVFSKLALLSSIKQRRASAIRPEPADPAASEPQLAASEFSALGISTAAELKSAEQPGHSEPSQRAEQPELARQEVREPEKPAAQNKGILQRNADIARPEAQPPAAAPANAPWAAKSTAAYDAPAASTLFASFEAPGKNPASGEPESFAKSGLGMAMLGVSIVALGLAAYLLLENGSKPSVSSSKPIAKQFVETGKFAAGRLTAAKRSEAPAPAGNSRVGDSRRDGSNAASSGAAPEAVSAPSQAPGETDAVPAVARTFAPPEPAGARPATTSPIFDAPPALATTSPAPSGIALPARIAPLPPPPATVPNSISVAGKEQTTKLVKQVTPVYPSLARTTRVQGTVRFRATIAADGQIKGLIPLGGPSPLVQAATDAVRQWRYRPTILNGAAVEVVTEIEVVFAL